MKVKNELNEPHYRQPKVVALQFTGNKKMTINLKDFYFLVFNCFCLLLL